MHGKCCLQDGWVTNPLYARSIGRTPSCSDAVCRYCKKVSMSRTWASRPCIAMPNRKTTLRQKTVQCAMMFMTKDVDPLPEQAEYKGISCLYCCTNSVYVASPRFALLLNTFLFQERDQYEMVHSVLYHNRKKVMKKSDVAKLLKQEYVKRRGLGPCRMHRVLHHSLKGGVCSSENAIIHVLSYDGRIKNMTAHFVNRAPHQNGLSTCPRRYHVYVVKR